MKVINKYIEINPSKELIEKVLHIHSVENLKELLEYTRPLSDFKPGLRIYVDNKMQRDYVYRLTEEVGKNFDPNFKPDFTPADMLSLGVFEGKYLNDCILEYPREWFEEALKNNKLSPARSDSFLNLYRTRSREIHRKWKVYGKIFGNDPRGWFEWYSRYFIGRRQPDVDEIQIKRWQDIRQEILTRFDVEKDLLHIKQRLFQWGIKY